MAGVYYIEDDRNLFFDDADSYRLGGLDPTRRIGLKIVKAVVEDPGIAIEISEGTRIGKTTIFGEYQDKGG